MEDGSAAGTSLPSTLVDLVRAKIGSLTAGAQAALLAAACLGDPTVELVAQANNTDGAHSLASSRRPRTKASSKSKGGAFISPIRY